MLLQTTEAGEAQITQARLKGTALPKFKSVIVDTANRQDDLRKPVIQKGYEAAIPVVTVDGGLMLFQINVPPDIDVLIRGFGLQTADGTIIAYARYFESAGGFPKRIGTNLLLECKYDVSGRNANEITFVYEPFDVSGLTEKIKQQILSELAADLTISAIGGADKNSAPVRLLGGNDG